MNYNDLIEHFGSEADAASARGVARQTVHRWKKIPVLPLDQQIAFEKLTDGKLRCSLSNDVRTLLGKNIAPDAAAAAGDQVPPASENPVRAAA